MRRNWVKGVLGLAIVLALPGLASDTGTGGQLPKVAAPLHYRIHIVPNAAALTFKGDEIVDVQVTSATPTLTLNAADLNVTRAIVDGNQTGSVAYDAPNQRMTVTFAAPLAPGTHSLAFDYSGKIYQTASGMFALDYAGQKGPERMLLTQFEAPDARRFAPMWDEPGYKTPFDLSVTVPAGQSAFSNMPQTSHHSNADGTSEVSFGTTPKMSSYLLFLGVGNIERHTVMSGKTEIGIITRKGVGVRGDYALSVASKVLKYYNDYFGTPYPLPKLDMIAAPGRSEFFSAMENWGAILYFERAVLVDPKLTSESEKQNVFNTIAHEMAHQWFGDLVTMKWWDDLWLNEGFASWMAAKVTGDLNPTWQVPAQEVLGARQAGIGLDSRGSTHPIIRHIETVDQIASAFDNITYLKGQAVIGMIEGALGPDKFRAGIRRYMAKYKYSNTETDQLWTELEAASGRNVVKIAHDFTLQAGVPLITVSDSQCIGGKRVVTLSQSRFGQDDASRAATTWQVPVIAQNATDRQTKVISGDAPQTITLKGCGTVRINPGQSGYFRTLYAPGPSAAVAKLVPSLPLIDQIGMISDANALTNAGYQPAGSYLALVEHLPATAHPMVWRQVAGQLDGYDGTFDGLAFQPAYRAKVLKLLRPEWARVGLTPKPGESSVMAQLRESMIGTMVGLGDAQATRDVRALMHAGFANTAKIPGAIRLPLLYSYAYTMTAAEWDDLHARARAEKDPLVKENDYSALGTAHDPALAQKALDLALTDEAPVPLRTAMIAAVAGDHHVLAFDFAEAHADQVLALLEQSARAGFIARLAIGSSDDALADRVKAFAERTLAPESRTEANAAITAIRIRARQRARLAPAFAAWANAH